MIIDRIQDLMAAPDMASIWTRYAAVAKTHAAQQLEAQISGYYDRPHATTYCARYGCRRQTAYKAHMIPGKPIQWRGNNTFAFGYAVEILVKAQLAELDIDFKDHKSFPLHWNLDGRAICVSPDCYDVHLDGQVYVVEIKSMASGTFERLEREGLRSTIPGYYDQVQLEIAATGSDAGIIVVENKNTAALYEECIQPDELRLAELDALFLQVHDAGTPEEIERAFGLAERTLYHRGKTPPTTINPLREKHDKNGRLIGHNEVVALCLPWQCRYCGWNARCWAPKQLVTTFDKGKPVIEVR